MFRRRIVYYGTYSLLSYAPYWGVINSRPIQISMVYEYISCSMKDVERIERDLKLLKSAVEINDMMFTPDFIEKDPILYSKLFKENEKIVERIKELEQKLSPGDH